MYYYYIHVLDEVTLYFIEVRLSTRNSFPEETNACRKRVWEFFSQSSTANSTITLQEAVLYPGWVAGLAECICIYIYIYIYIYAYIL